MNFTTPYNTTDFFYTKEENAILFDTEINNTFFTVVVDIKSFAFYSERSTSKTLRYKVPLFENKAVFYLGDIIDRSMARIQEIDLYSLFQYKNAKVTLTIQEIDIESNTVLSSNTIGPINFVAGYLPEKVRNNCAFLDMYNLPRRAVENGYAFVNMILTTGSHTFNVLKNGRKIESFVIDVLSSNICSRSFKLDNYEVIKGDIFEIQFDAFPDLRKQFRILPKAMHSNYIAFEDEYLLKSIIECTGDYRFSLEFTSKMNKIQKKKNEITLKASSKTDIICTINTGFVLESEETFIETLQRSKRAWIIIGQNEGIELVPNNKKMQKFDPETALYSYDIEYIVNPIDAKPLQLLLDNPINIMEQDVIAPTEPQNLQAMNTRIDRTVLSWEPSSDAYGVFGYDVFQNEVYIGSTALTTFNVLELEASTIYNFYVVAKDAAGNVSLPSETIEVNTPGVADDTAPSVPTDLLASDITTNSLMLTWTASTDAVGVTKYNVFKNGIKIGDSSNPIFNVTGLLSNTSYSFYVTAQDASGNISNESTAISVTTEAAQYSTFWYEGFFPYSEFGNSGGGAVTYVDVNGITVTENGFFQGDCRSIVAQSIISTLRVQTCNPI